MNEKLGLKKKTEDWNIWCELVIDMLSLTPFVCVILTMRLWTISVAIFDITIFKRTRRVNDASQLNCFRSKQVYQPEKYRTSCTTVHHQDRRYTLQLSAVPSETSSIRFCRLHRNPRGRSAFTPRTQSASQQYATAVVSFPRIWSCATASSKEMAGAHPCGKSSDRSSASTSFQRVHLRSMAPFWKQEHLSFSIDPPWPWCSRFLRGLLTI